MTYKEYIIATASKGYINIYHSSRGIRLNTLCTLNSESIKQDHKKPSIDNKKMIALYDVYGDQYISINIDNIISTGVDFENNIDQHKEFYQKLINEKDRAFDAARKLGCELSDLELSIIYQSVPVDVFNFLSIFKHKIKHQDVIDDKVTDNDLKFAKECWLDCIRQHRVTAFNELDELEAEAKKAGSSEDDLDDINTIKQMFRDIPEDSNLDQYKTFSELIEFWPALLQPLPEELKCVKYIRSPYNEPPSQSKDPLADLSTILKSIDDREGLEQLLAELVESDNLYIPKNSIKLVQDRIDQLQK